MLDQIEMVEKKEKKSMLEKSMGPGGFGNSLFVSQIGMNPVNKMAKSTL